MVESTYGNKKNEISPKQSQSNPKGQTRQKERGIQLRGRIETVCDRQC